MDEVVERVNLGYTPRPLQQVLHNELRRFNVLVCHRRFGKTVFAIMQMITQGLANNLPNPQYAYIGPTYRQAKRVAWQYFVDFLANVPNVKVNKTELTIYVYRPDRICPKTGLKRPDVIKFMLIGADDPDDIRGIYLDGGVLDEFASMDPQTWSKVVRPALADRKKIALDYGLRLEPWAIFIGTPLGQNHFYRRYKKSLEYGKFAKSYMIENNIRNSLVEWAEFETKYGLDAADLPDKEMKRILSNVPSETVVDEYKRWRKFKVAVNWYTTILRASETGVLDQEELDEMREDLSEEEIEQELECNFSAAIKGSYYGYLINDATNDGRIGDIPFNPKYPVDTHWDIGIGDSTSIWFRQKINGFYNYINYIEVSGKGIPYLAQYIQALGNGKGVRTTMEDGEVVVGLGYVFGRHVWPHDGGTRDFSTGVTRQETARTLGLIIEVQAKQKIEDRIQATRTRLKISRFDETLCERGISCLYNYMKEWDDKLQIFKNKPKHDWSSHGSDSFGYSALDDRDSGFRNKYGGLGEAGKQEFAANDYDEFGG